jgi:hypothetical protein
MNRKVLQNAVRKDGIYYQSLSRHDFVQVGKDGSFIDGGTDYVRQGGEFDEDLTLFCDQPLVELVDKLLWGTNGPNGDQPVKWILLKDAETDHLQKIIANVPHVGRYHAAVIGIILGQRAASENKITINGKILSPQQLSLVRSAMSEQNRGFKTLAKVIGGEAGGSFKHTFKDSDDILEMLGGIK